MPRAAGRFGFARPCDLGDRADLLSCEYSETLNDEKVGRAGLTKVLTGALTDAEKACLEARAKRLMEEPYSQGRCTTSILVEEILERRGGVVNIKGQES